MSWLSDFFGGGKEAQPAGATFLQNPQYSQVAPAIGQGWDYLSNGLQALQEGKPPTWFQNWRPLEESQRRNALTGTYYGAGAGAEGGNMFGPGVLATQRAADVKAGRRGAGGGSNYAKQLDMYAQGMNDIGDYLSKLGAESMQTAEGRYLSGMASMPQGPQGQWQTYGATPYQPSGFESMMQGAGNLLPYAFMGPMGGSISGAMGNLGGGLGRSLSNIFGGGGGGSQMGSAYDAYFGTNTGMMTPIGGQAFGQNVINQFSPTRSSYNF